MEKLPIHFSRLAEQIYVGMKFLPLMFNIKVRVVFLIISANF